MKKVFIVANWKSNKTESEAKDWLFAVLDLKNQDLSNKEVIVCPSFICLPGMKDIIEEQKLPIKLGTQDVSPFAQGAYTGEIFASQVSNLVKYSIIGHSERRKYFHETDDDVITKLKHLIENNITPILCVSDMNQMDYFLSKDTAISDEAENIIFVYEPPNAISVNGQFRAESPDVINQNAGQINQKIGKKVSVLYGGSVNTQNAKSISVLDNINGFLIGKASLDPLEFLQIIKNA